MKLPQIAICVMVVMLVLLGEVPISESVTCNPSALNPCSGAIFGSGSPSLQCCSKLKEQKPCLCGYLKNPTLRQYILSPNGRKVTNACKVPIPNC